MGMEPWKRSRNIISAPLREEGGGGGGGLFPYTSYIDMCRPIG